MVVLCLAWSLQQVALKATAPDVATSLQIAIRCGVAVLLVALSMRLRGERLVRDRALAVPLFLVSALFALEFLFIAEGLRYTTASHMTVFLYTAPLFAAIGLHATLPGERLTALQWAGIGCAFAGIVVAFLGRDGGATASAPNMPLGDLLGLLAGAAWGATTVLIRKTRIAALPATQTLLYQLLGAALLMFVEAAASGQMRFRPTSFAFASIAFQAVVVTFASYLTWFWLLRQYLASRLGVYSFLTPLFGIVFGAWLLAEPVDPGFLSGATMVIVGILVVSGARRVQKALRRVATDRGTG